MHKALSAAICNQTRVIRNYGQRPDGVTIVSWFSGRNLVWNATVFDTFAPPYMYMHIKLWVQQQRKEKIKTWVPHVFTYLLLSFWKVCNGLSGKT